jgi:transposase
MTFDRVLKQGNNYYKVSVESYRENGKVKQRYVKWVGKCDSGGNPVTGATLEGSEVSDVYPTGWIAVVKKMAESIDLAGILDSSYERELLSLVYAHLKDYRSLEQMEQFLRENDPEVFAKFSRSRYESAMDSLTGKKIMEIQGQIYATLRDHFSSDVMYYDLTHVYFYGSSPWVEEGYNAERRREDQMTLGLAVERKYGLPVFHLPLKGNISDKKTLGIIVSKLQSYGIKNCTLIFDRGITTGENLKAIKEAGYTVTSGFSLRGRLKDRAVEYMKEAGVKDMVKLSERYLYVKELNKKYMGARVIICLNEESRVLIKKKRYEKLYSIISGEEKPSPRMVKFLDKVNGKYEINYEAVEKRERTDGIYAIITTTESDPATVINGYYEKDLIEKAFQSLKGVVGIQPIRFWLYGRVPAHIFVCYLSYLLLALMRKKLIDSGNNQSPLQVMKELSPLYRVTVTDTASGKSIRKFSPVSVKQRELFKIFGL